LEKNFVRKENKMVIIDFLKEYWVLIMFFFGEIGALLIFVKAIFEGIKCSLRNDILQIYESCKHDRKITLYQLQAVELSFSLYDKLKGNSFVKKIVEQMRTFEIVD
jgi:hypothetical protein